MEDLATLQGYMFGSGTRKDGYSEDIVSSYYVP